MAGRQTLETSSKHTRRRWVIAALVLALVTGFALWATAPENLRGLKNQIHDWQWNSQHSGESYNAKSLVVEDLATGKIFVSKCENEPLPPASLAKLFTINYALSVVEPGDIVTAAPEALALVKPGSSVADIQPGSEYSVENLVAAMLVPSGNDAAYVLADYVASRTHPGAIAGQERIGLFLTDLNEYAHAQGWSTTTLNDPSGYDFEGATTVTDLRGVSEKLLKFQWIRNIVAQSSYTATLPSGQSQTWVNTNKFLEPGGTYFNPGVHGMKTGSLDDDYNLITLYSSGNKEFLIVSIGSQSDTSRYDDIAYLLKTIDESYYLHEN
ncbi:MAG: serine hydrolase [Arcanobacterium sp.]|nr:serine hydrolase [Arcanobacterium sp.]